MKNDIVTVPVTDVLVAAVPRSGGEDDVLWDIYVVNLRDEDMENVLIASQGYGSVGGVDKTTTVLRHFHQRIAAKDYLKVEPIQTELFALENEYWISFGGSRGMQDHKFRFKPGQISPEALENVPVLDRPGVFLRT